MVARSMASTRQREKQEREEEDDVGLTPDAWRELAAEGEKITFDNPLQKFIAEFRQGKVSPYKLARKLLLAKLVAPTHVEREGALMLFPTEWVLYTLHSFQWINHSCQDCYSRVQITVSAAPNTIYKLRAKCWRVVHSEPIVKAIEASRPKDNSDPIQCFVMPLFSREDVLDHWAKHFLPAEVKHRSQVIQLPQMMLTFHKMPLITHILFDMGTYLGSLIYQCSYHV